MKTIKEGDRLNDVWMVTCYKYGAKVECTTGGLNYIFSPDFGAEISDRGHVKYPTCGHENMPVIRQ